MKENTFIFGKMKQQKIFYWKQSQIDSNDNTHHNSVVEKYFITRHYNLHKMPIYSNQLVNRYQSGTDVQSTHVKTKIYIFYE